MGLFRLYEKHLSFFLGGGGGGGYVILPYSKSDSEGPWNPIARVQGLACGVSWLLERCFEFFRDLGV